MIAHIPIKCPYCKKTHVVSEREITDLLSHMKMNRVLEVASQMQTKTGLYYDRWLVAMEARGPQLRCIDCISHHANDLGLPRNYCIFCMKVVHPAWFACRHINTFATG